MGSTSHQGMPRGWARPCALWAASGPPPVDLGSSIFYIFHKNSSKSFAGFEELLFLHKNNTMVVLVKRLLVRVSFIQIMQIRVQNKSKSVRKSRYDGHVSPLKQSTTRMPLELRLGGVNHHAPPLRTTLWANT